ncbi:hypothetical protein INT44_005197 [Umbelopsis vinacea]|uniref:Uncharacterized protein n=1 Tax=Umbelopsis vinacea TaxID=44442 RepID=A0A8H7UPQ4_9FUNG|nr:hypothetical protein INT44_005197 [Umbelopsis vinacea]
MNKPRTRHSINRWSNLLQLFKTKSTKSFDSDQISEICKPWRRRPSAMSDDSALSSTPSEECIIEKVVDQFHNLYTHAVDELAYAQESLGSIYYTNDRDAALEATRNCIDALASWREQGKGNKERERLYDAMKPRIRDLQRQCEALPILSRYSHDA